MPSSCDSDIAVSNHCKSSNVYVYIHKHQCARETVVWEYKSSNVGINRFMLLLECVVTSSKQIVQQLPFGLI